MAAGRLLSVLALVALFAAPVEAVEHRAAKNPVRKVVNLLQAMQKKVEEEGKKETELFDKYMCYCGKGKKDLEKSIADAEAVLSTTGPENEAGISKVEQAKSDVARAKADRQAAQEAVAQATALRKKEAAAYAAEQAENEANIQAVTQATAAVEKGQGAAFLQSGADRVARVRRVATSLADQLSEEDRQALGAFLSEDSGSDAQTQGSGEVVGILKQLGDQMRQAAAESAATEAEAKTSNEELLAAKGKEIDALTVTIETKMAQIGELGVSIEQQKASLEDAKVSLAEDKKFLAELDSGCATKAAEWEERKKVRADELVALADTIKLLNDDDALDLFKNTLPGPATSFLQLQVSMSAMRARALAGLRAARERVPKRHRIDLSFLVTALTSKTAGRGGFDAVIKMIDGMVGALNKEQADDEAKKDYCTKELDIAEDKKKEQERLVADAETAIATVKEGINTLVVEIGELSAGIRALDKSVAEATKQRQLENADYKELMANNGAAKELLAVAKNRLNKFYNPKLYKPEANPEAEAASLVQVAMHRARDDEQAAAAPPPPPETFGAYTKKSEESGGVIQMIDLLISDLEKEMVQAETDEKNSQEDYEKLMADAAGKRTIDAETITQKESAKADMEGTVEGHGKAKAEALKAVEEKVQYIQLLHNQCDWIFKYFDMRKEARTDEIDALNKAKAVLSGADFSFMQVSAHRHLRRPRLAA